MISENCDFSDFVRAAQGKNYEEVIYLADREATDAERQYYRFKGDREVCGKQYARNLKAFIRFLRYGVKPSKCKREDLLQFKALRGDLNLTQARPKWV